MALKEQLAEKYNCKSALKSPPHITLHMPFQWRSDREDLLIEKLREFDFSGFSIDILLKGFGFFDPGVVFVDVVENENLTKLQSELIGYIRKSFNLFNANYKDKPFHPHVTIGFRDIKKSLFPEIKAEYMLREFEGKFQTSGFHLLKHNGKTWDEFVLID
ncbi:MAG: 2'-5' RNA ligase family protein [Reichenbachiella sp.]